MTRSTPRRPRRWIVALTSVVGVLVVLGVVGEVVLRGIIDDRIERTAADLPAGISVERDDTLALWQVATGRAKLRVGVTPEAITEAARDSTDLQELEVAPDPGGLVAQLPLTIAGNTQNVDVLLSVAAEGGKAVVRADSARVAGITLALTAVAGQLDNPDLNRLVEGVAFPEGESPVAISSARATNDGLELGAEVVLWG